jgi:hypothetical protein
MSDIRDPNTSNIRPFKDLSLAGKLAFLGKAVIFFVSGGFIFPTLWVD